MSHASFRVSQRNMQRRWQCRSCEAHRRTAQSSLKRGRGAVDGLLPARTVLELRKLARVQKNRSNVHPHRSCGCLFHGKAPGMAAHRRSDDRPNDSAPGGQGTPRRSALNSTSSCPTGAQTRAIPKTWRKRRYSAYPHEACLLLVVAATSRCDLGPLSVDVGLPSP